MQLYEEIISAMRSNKPHQSIYDILLHTVKQAKSDGITQRDTYEALSRAYEELGCNDGRYDDLSALCDVIGNIMDRVWGWCPRGQEIWESSLSKEREEK